MRISKRSSTLPRARAMPRLQVAKILESGRKPHGNHWGLEEGSQGREEVRRRTLLCVCILEKLGKQRGCKAPLLWISPDLPGPQLPLSMHQTTVLIRLGLALGFAEGWLAVPGGPEACRGPWGEVGGRGECGVWGEGGGRGG